MKKQTVIYFAIISVCILFTIPVNAAPPAGNSEVRVEFEAGSGPTHPVNPEDPDVDSNEGGVDGSFAIVSVSHFDFGEELPVEAITRLYDIQTHRPNIQVVDLRGTGAGWRVSAKVSSFSSDGGTATLPGAAIHIRTGRPNSKSVSDPPVNRQDVKLTTDNSTSPVIDAPAGAGAGLWVMRWYPPVEESGIYVQLEIPAGSASIGRHTATINWILEDTPSE